MASLDEKRVKLIVQVLGLTNSNLSRDYIQNTAKILSRYDRSDSIDRSLDLLMEVLSQSDEETFDLYFIAKVVGVLKRYEELSIKNNGADLLLEILKLTHPDLDLKYLSKVINVFNNFDELEDFEDSLSENQFYSKLPLLKKAQDHGLIKPESVVVIWGCWYGSILIPYLEKQVAKVIGIDQDDEVIRVAVNWLFDESPNVDLITDDIFATYRNFYLDTSLIINTACEHMPPMKDWPWFKNGAMDTDPDYIRKEFKSPKLSTGCGFAFQSNDMTGIEGHTNCVQSLEEFKSQLPDRAKILFEDEIKDERGRRFMLIGRLQ